MDPFRGWWTWRFQFVNFTSLETSLLLFLGAGKEKHAESLIMACLPTDLCLIVMFPLLDTVKAKDLMQKIDSIFSLLITLGNWSYHKWEKSKANIQSRRKTEITASEDTLNQVQCQKETDFFHGTESENICVRVFESVFFQRSTLNSRHSIHQVFPKARRCKKIQINTPVLMHISWPPVSEIQLYTFRS